MLRKKQRSFYLLKFSIGHTLVAQGHTKNNSAEPRRLTLVPVRVSGTSTQSVLDTGAVPNLISSLLATEIALKLEANDRKIKVAYAKTSKRRVVVGIVPLLFVSKPASLEPLLVERIPVDIIIEIPTL